MTSPLPSPRIQPKVVTLMVRFLYASLVIEVASYFWGWFTFKDFDISGTSFSSVFSLTFYGGIFFLWLTFKIAEGANRARIVFVVLFLFYTSFLLFIHRSI